MTAPDAPLTQFTSYLSPSLSRGDPLTPRNCLIWRRLVLTVAPVTSLPENGGGSAVRTGRRLARAPGAFLARSVDRYRRRSVARRVPPRPVATCSGRPATGIHRLLIGKRPSQSSEIVLGYFPVISPRFPDRELKTQLCHHIAPPHLTRAQPSHPRRVSTRAWHHTRGKGRGGVLHLVDRHGRQHHAGDPEGARRRED